VDQESKHGAVCGGDVLVAARAAFRPIRSPTSPRRGLNREEAAQYVGISPSKFDQLVADGRMPGPKLLDRRRVWDMRRLDQAFELLPGSGGPNPWDDD